MDECNGERRQKLGEPGMMVNCGARSAPSFDAIARFGLPPYKSRPQISRQRCIKTFRTDFEGSFWRRVRRLKHGRPSLTAGVAPSSGEGWLLNASRRSGTDSWETWKHLALQRWIGATAAVVAILLGGPFASASGSEHVERSGLPIPRFVSVKSKPANVRAGPGIDYPLRWTFVRRHLPVEILAEFDNWRRIRDADGEEGWILAALLSGRRTALVAPWSAAKPVRLRNHSRPNSAVNAVVEPRVLVMVDTCAGVWCYVRAETFSGYVRQTRLWGVYPDEVF